MQELLIVGNLTRDPESRTTSTGKEVCSFTVAVNRRQKKQDGSTEADFFRVNAWEQMGRACQSYLAKGKKVAVRGQVSVHAYQDKEGKPAATLEVFANEVEFLTPNGQGSSEQHSPQNTSASQSAPTDGYQTVASDELPF